jgi:hypothetical protein
MGLLPDLLEAPSAVQPAVDCILNVMAYAQKPDFVFRPNGQVHLNRRWRQFRRLLAAEVWASAVVMLDIPCSEVVWRVMATHSIRHTCVGYRVVHVTDIEPSVHVYSSDTASQTALQLPQDNGQISALLHIITDGTRYTEHNVGVHRNRTNMEQKWHCTYNVTQLCVRVTTVAVGKK